MIYLEVQQLDAVPQLVFIHDAFSAVIVEVRRVAVFQDGFGIEESEVQLVPLALFVAVLQGVPAQQVVAVHEVYIPARGKRQGGVARHSLTLVGAARATVSARRVPRILR